MYRVVWHSVNNGDHLLSSTRCPLAFEDILCAVLNGELEFYEFENAEQARLAAQDSLSLSDPSLGVEDGDVVEIVEGCHGERRSICSFTLVVSVVASFREVSKNEK